jgi:hypothetical protein
MLRSWSDRELIRLRTRSSRLGVCSCCARPSLRDTRTAGLAIWIVGVNDHVGNVHVDIGVGQLRSDDRSKLLSKRVLDVFAAGVLDHFQFELALFCLGIRVLEQRPLVRCPPKHRDIDVFRKP